MADTWKLYYHSYKVCAAGRAECLRIIFEEAGVEYTFIDENVVELFGDKLHPQYAGFPCYAVPVIERVSDGFNVAQVAVISRYLGRKYGLYPDNEADEWHADQLNVTIHGDYIAEGRNAFHAKEWDKSYFGQEEFCKPYVAAFVKERMPKFLEHFEKTLSMNNGGKGFLYGNKITYADLSLLYCLRATVAQFPDEFTQLKTIPLLKDFKTRLEARPKLSAYFKSDRCKPFSNNSMGM